MSDILINGKKQSHFLTVKKEDNLARRTSFTGLALPNNFDEISQQLDNKSSGKKVESHINAVVFTDKVKKNMNKIFNNHEELDQKENNTENIDNFNKKTFMRI